MASKLIALAKKDAAVARILAGQSTVADEARRLSVTQEAVRKWKKDYLRRHPEAEPKLPDPPAAAPSPAPTATPEPLTALDGGAEAARAAIGMQPAAGPAPAAGAGTPPPVQPQVMGLIANASRQEDEDLTFFYASLLVSGEVRIPLMVLTARKPFKVTMTPELEAKCVLTEGEKSALRPAAPLVARKIRELMGSSENATWAGLIIALSYGAIDRATAVVKAVNEAAARYEREKDGGSK